MSNSSKATTADVQLVLHPPHRRKAAKAKMIDTSRRGDTIQRSELKND
jgi:hypothetical protein